MEMFFEHPDFEQTDLVLIDKIKQNTLSIFYSFVAWQMDIDEFETIKTLYNSIKTLENKDAQFSEPLLIRKLLNSIAPDDYCDLFYLHSHEKELIELQSLLKPVQINYDSEVDQWAKNEIRTKLNGIKSDIGSVKHIIQLITDFRMLLLEVIPNLEIQFLQKFDEYTEQQEQIALENNIQIIEPDVIVAPKIYPKEMFDHLPDSNLPIINKDIINPDFVFENYHNNGIKCSPFAFYAWLVYGKKYEVEKLEWTFKTKAQLKLFIDKITGTTDTAKESYFNQVFGISLKLSDYRNSNTLDKHFILLQNEIDKKKLNIKNKV